MVSIIILEVFIEIDAFDPDMIRNVQILGWLWSYGLVSRVPQD